MSELVVLVDEKNNPIGTAPKTTVHTNNTPLHRGFSVFLFNGKGEVLLQQRGSAKKTWPLVWSNSCCGHPAPREDVVSAAKRRLKYELGLGDIELTVALPNFRYRAETDGIVENELCPVLVGISDAEPRLNPSEVENVHWKPWQTFCAETKTPQNPYSPWAVLEMEALQKSNVFKAFYAKVQAAS